MIPVFGIIQASISIIGLIVLIISVLNMVFIQKSYWQTALVYWCSHQDLLVNFAKPITWLFDLWAGICRQHIVQPFLSLNIVNCFWLLTWLVYINICRICCLTSINVIWSNCFCIFGIVVHLYYETILKHSIQFALWCSQYM